MTHPFVTPQSAILKLKIAVALLSCCVPLAAQVHSQESASTHEAKLRFPEVEFAASDVFRSGSYIQPLWKELQFEGHYFGDSAVDVGYAGASWLFRLKGVGLAPGFGAVFGSHNTQTKAAATFRWDFEKKWFVTQGLVIQSFRKTPLAEGEEHVEEAPNEHAGESKFVRPSISDGSHVSSRWKRVTIGPTWEHINSREANEWKAGGRLAIRFARHASAILYVLAPGRTEFRAGLLIHPAQREE